MATTSTGVTIEDLKAVSGTLRTALQTRDFLLARQYACEAQIIMVCLGSSVSASGTNFQLAVQAANDLIANMEKLQIYSAMKSSNRRIIRTGLTDGGRRHGSSGVLHD